MNEEVKFYPAKIKNSYRHWMENVRDWCISRQLWWGQRIPAYYLPDGRFRGGQNRWRKPVKKAEDRIQPSGLKEGRPAPG